MKHLNTLSIAVGIALVVSPSFAGSGEADDRVTSLLGRMTLEEKVGQLCERVTQDLSLVNGGDMEGRAFDNEIVQVIRRGEVGTFVGVPGPEAHNLYQKAAVEGSRLGIPLMFGRGYVHGCHVTFPIPLAQSCSWEPELFRRTCEFTAVVGDEVVLSARIANVGKRRGSEVVQAYVRDRVAEVSRPRRELKGFVRVELAPGESRRVEIRVPRAELAYWANGRRTEATGEFLAWIAPDSDSGRRLSFTLP